MHPSLVVVSYNPNGLEATLAAAHIPVMEQDAANNLRGTLRQITWLGDATGHYERSYDVASADKHEIDKDVARGAQAPPCPSDLLRARPDAVLAHLDDLRRTAAQVPRRDEHRRPAGSPLNGGYPQLTPELIVGANPQMIFLADTVCCHQDYATVAARPGFSILAAVKHHEVIKLNDDVASRWGPRVSVLMDDLTAAVLKYYKA